MKISIGAKGEFVGQLQKQLQAKGFGPGPMDQVFGQRTRRALIAYQLSVGLEADGILGELTRASLGLKFEMVAVPETRTRFRQLILSNPNYFGTSSGSAKGSAMKAVVAQAGNTEFEELVCLGYQPQLDRLVAVVEIKQMSGYGGPLCGFGSAQNLRFFIDWTGDGKWMDVGVARFPSHDIPEPNRLYNAVHIPLHPLRRSCKSPFLPRVRAILSWNDVPPADEPNYIPPWGNALESTIQIEARPPWIFESIPGIEGPFSSQIIAQINENISDAIQQSVVFGHEPFAAPPLPAQAEAFAKAKIPALRYAAPLLTHLGKTKSAAEIAALAPSIEKQLGIPRLSTLLEQWFNPGDGDQSYEELRCVGYDRERQSLSAIVKIKQPSGYGGDLCEQGSREYVSFWVWDEATLTWSRLGSASVPVYDLPVPAEGVDYEVYLPVDFSPYQRPCEEGFTTLRIRAILAWNSVVTDPNHTPYWGNREDITVVLRPGPRLALGTQMPFFASIGDIPVCNIDPITGYANGPGVITGRIVEDAPFGGMITITGFFSSPPSTLSEPKPKYRLSVRPFKPLVPDSANPWQPLTNDFRVRVATSVGGGVAYQSWLSQTIDADGYYTYQEVFGTNAWRVVTGRVLGRWASTTPHDIYELRIEGKDALGTMVATGVIDCGDGTTRQAVHIHLDNERPRAELRITGVIRKGETRATPASDCDKFYVGDQIIGTYTATDMHFSRASLQLQPNPRPTPPAPVAEPQLLGVRSYDGGLNPYGEALGDWMLDTTNMRPCGYSLWLEVVDRTIVDSRTLNPWRMSATIGFCLELPPT